MSMASRSASLGLILTCLAAGAPPRAGAARAADGASLLEALDAARHAVRSTESGLIARNPGQRWTTSFDARGFVVEPDHRAWSWGLELVDYGWGPERRAPELPSATAADGGRLARAWDACLEEWYVNDAR